MDDDRKLPPCNEGGDSKIIGRRSHQQIMASLGYETPAPVVKRTKSAWEDLVEAYPCPPEYQHKVWANRIKRLYRLDCGLISDWDCECLKCESALADEVYGYHVIECNMQTVDADEEMDKVAASFTKEDRANPVDLRAISCGYAPGPVIYRPVDEVGSAVFSGHVHLFREQSHVGATDGPHTPFLTILSINDYAEPIKQPRVMWVRAKTVEPVHFSFK